MKITLLLFIIFLLPTVTSAQENHKSVIRYFTHSHGISYQKFENINKRVAAAAQYETPKNTIGTLQFGLISERERSTFFYMVTVGSSLSGDKKKRSTATKSIGFSVDYGYNISTKNRFSFYPLVGLSFEKYKLILNKDVTAVPFDSVLQSPAFRQGVENVIFTNSFIAFKVGAGINARSTKHPRNSVGLQFGYSGSLNNSEWKINTTQSLANSPYDKLSKLFVHLLVRYQLKKS